jgi:hypothetical protein
MADRAREEARSGVKLMEMLSARGAVRKSRGIFRLAIQKILRQQSFCIAFVGQYSVFGNNA